MSAEALVDFQDIYEAVCKKVKIQLTDGETVSRIKQDINMIYLDEVLPFKKRAWTWAHTHDQILTQKKYNTGTISATVGSLNGTFSTAPSFSCAGMLIKMTAYPEIYRINTHTAATTSFTFEEVFIADSSDDGTAFTGMGFKIWQDRYLIDADISEVIQITTDKRSKPLDAYNKAQFDEYVQNNPELEGIPAMYSDDEDVDGQKYIYLYPSCFDKPVRMKITGMGYVDKLDNDADEPIIPLDDRIVLYYGALSFAWERERNETESAKAWNLFQTKLGRMAARAGDAPQVTEMTVDHNYLQNKRYRRFVGSQRRRRWEAD